MKHLTLTTILLGLLLSIPSFASDLDRIDYIPGDPVPELRCSRLNHCLVSLPEEAVLTKVLIPDVPRWVIDLLEAGGRTVLAITPRYCGLSSRITIGTVEELYDFPLSSICETEDTDLNPIGPATHVVIHRRPEPILPPPPPQPEPLIEITEIEEIEEETVCGLAKLDPVEDPSLIPIERMVSVRSRVRHAEIAAPIVYEDTDGRTIIQFLEPPPSVPILGKTTVRGKTRVGKWFRKVFGKKQFEAAPGVHYDAANHRLITSQPLEGHWTILVGPRGDRLTQTPRVEIREVRS